MDFSNIALFSDLDGTLFDRDLRVSPENRAALERFVDGGGLFGISTGRSPSNAALLLPELPINTWSVVLGGAEAYRFSSRTVAFPRTLTRLRMAVFLRTVLQLLPEVTVLVCSESCLFFLSPPQQVDRAFLDSHQPASFVTLERALQFPWLKVLFHAPRELLRRLEEGAAKRGVFEVCCRVYTQPDYLELLPVGTNKGACLHRLRNMEELLGRTIVAVGDWTNDLELLGEADVAVAVENALPEVKYRADFLTADHNNHALAHLIHHILPQIRRQEPGG